MTTVTFVYDDGTGTETCAVSCSLVYGTDFYDERLNQYAVDTGSGARITYDGGPNRTHGKLVMKNMSYADGVALKTWIKTQIIFQLYTFTINGIINVDLGLGRKVISPDNLTLCYWDGGTDLEKWFVFTAPGIYEVTFPYFFVS
jgi:hypothetical protein